MRTLLCTAAKKACATDSNGFHIASVRIGKRPSPRTPETEAFPRWCPSLPGYFQTYRPTLSIWTLRPGSPRLWRRNTATLGFDPCAFNQRDNHTALRDLFPTAKVASAAVPHHPQAIPDKFHGHDCPGSAAVVLSVVQVTAAKPPKSELGSGSRQHHVPCGLRRLPPQVDNHDVGPVTHGITGSFDSAA